VIRALFARLVVVSLLLGVGLLHQSQAVVVPSEARQLLVAVAADWDSSSGFMTRFERSNAKSPWRVSRKPIPVLFGKSGLAWGLGLHPQVQGTAVKRERDGRTPAGVFRIGTIFSHDNRLPEGADYPFVTVGAGDAWIDDVSRPDYNRHVRVDPRNPPAWFARQRMETNEPVYQWLVEIRHNSDPPQPGMGSAIFFHKRRGPKIPTAGCTTMATEELVSLIRWLRSPSKPHYVVLPETELRRNAAEWGIPLPPKS
jgi:L,D-peptidoglycan transpeptidase YkuD (ErfK/YbiS/YcfS/YnhG family)